MSKGKTTDWGSAVHDITQRQHDRTKNEAKSEREKLLSIIEEQEQQLDAALAIKNASLGEMLKFNVSTKKNEAVAVALASDWHVEEEVDPLTVNGLNEYTLEIARKRIHNFFQNVIKLTDIQREGADVDTLVLALLGDFMTGYIHEELVEVNGLSPTETILWVIKELSAGLLLLEKKGNFKQIVIPCCYGNHGRTTRKPRHATGARNSYEWMMYQILADKMPQFKWQISGGYHNYLRVDDRVLRFHHGDGLRYQGGVGGLTIPVEKAISSWNKAITADLDCFGHWHTSQQNPKWISNASLIGHNAYAISIKAAYEVPSQTYFLLDKKRGRTITAPIFLD